jgi:hypothetical protein
MDSADRTSGSAVLGTGETLLVVETPTHPLCCRRPLLRAAAGRPPTPLCPLPLRPHPCASQTPCRGLWASCSLFLPMEPLVRRHLKPLEDLGLPAADMCLTLLMSPLIELPPHPTARTPAAWVQVMVNSLRMFNALVAEGYVSLQLQGVRKHMLEVEDLIRVLTGVSFVGTKANRLWVSRAFVMEVWSLSAAKNAVEFGIRDAIDELLGTFPSPLSSTGATIPPSVLDRLARRDGGPGRTGGGGNVSVMGAGEPSGVGAAGGGPGSGAAALPRMGQGVAPTASEALSAVCPSCAHDITVAIETVEGVMVDGLLQPGPALKQSKTKDYYKTRSSVRISCARARVCVCGGARSPRGTAVGPSSHSSPPLSAPPFAGVPRNAEAADLKKAYRKLALEWRPDTVTKDMKEVAKKKFQVRVGRRKEEHTRVGMGREVVTPPPRVSPLTRSDRPSITPCRTSARRTRC